MEVHFDKCMWTCDWLEVVYKRQKIVILFVCITFRFVLVTISSIIHNHYYSITRFNIIACMIILNDEYIDDYCIFLISDITEVSCCHTVIF